VFDECQIVQDSEGRLWRVSEARYATMLAEGVRQEWIAYHDYLARVHETLAAENRDRALKLADEGED